MKLLDLLVKELPELGGWPDGVTHIEQDYDRELMFYGRGDVRTGVILNELAIDHRKCGEVGEKITREQYEAALAASKAVVVHDSWIQWDGGECPVDSDAIVEVKYRHPSSNQFNNDRAGDFYWPHDGLGYDIIAYRLQKPGIDTRTNDDRLEQDLNECIGQDFDPAWSGNGLPPVGAKVEFFINPKFGYRNDWIPDAGTEMEVVAHKTTTDGNDVAVCYWDDDGAGRSCCLVPESLKPLRTEAEKKRDAFINAVLDDMRVIPCDLSLRDEVAVIYDAIAAGKIPGVKLEDK